MNLFKTNDDLKVVQTIVERYRSGDPCKDLSDDQLWEAKNVYDSAFHPDTGEKMTLLGRMSFQVPGNMVITGAMITFYQSTPAVLFWQWINQSFNATVNYTNRSGDSPISVNRLGTSYVLATTGAIATALVINKQVKRFPPIVGRFVPFVAVAAANCINIPCMRSSELTEGLTVLDEDDNVLGKSPAAARTAITQVVMSRVFMASPGMLIPPFVMNALEKRGVLRRMPWISAPLQIALCGFILTFATPMCCALFPQKSSIAFSSLEPELQKEIVAKSGAPLNRVYFNKGL